MTHSKGRGGMLNTCPHCKAKAVTYTSRKVTDLVFERYMQCTDVECGHQYVVQLGVLRTLMPSAKPDPAISIPLVKRRNNDIVVARAAAPAMHIHQHVGFLPAPPRHTHGNPPSPALN